MRMRLAFAFVLSFGLAALAQSPNTATLVINVIDQAGAAVPDAKISVLNNATGAFREAASMKDGNAVIPALPLTGTYTVTINKEGFAPEERTDITFRSGETATLKVKLVAGKAEEVTVFGTTEGVRADPQIGRRLDSKQIDETPILGRKLSSL